MLDQIKKLIGHSAIYGLSLVGSTIATTILTPLYLHRLSQAEYGMNEVLNVTGSIMYTILNLGISAVYVKVYLNDCKDDDQRNTLLSSMIGFAFIVTLVLTSLSFLLGKPLSGLLFDSRRYGNLVQLVIVSTGLQIMLAVVTHSLRAKQWTVKFVVVNLSQFMSITVLSFYLVAERNMGVLGIQTSSAVCLAAAVCMGVVILRSDLVLRFSGAMVKRFLMISLPLLPATIAVWVLNMSDRYILTHYRGLADAGMYAAGYKLGMVGMIALITASQFAWPPILYANMSAQNVGDLCASYAKYFLLVLVTAALGFSVFAPEIMRVIAAPQYGPAYHIVPFIAAAYVAYGMQFYSGAILIGVNKGVYLSYVLCGAAVINMLLNFMLVPRFGIWGATAATFVAFLADGIACLSLANRFFPVPHQSVNLVKIIGVGVLIFLVFGCVKPAPVPGLVWKAAGLPAMLGLLFTVKVFTTKEQSIMHSALGRMTRKVLTYAGKADA